MYLSPLYAALLSLLFIGLSVRTVRLRRRLGIPIGERGSAEMLRAMRVHANFAEYVPLALLLILMLEFQGASAYIVNLLGLVLLGGRAVHAFGVSREPEDYRFRVFGMAMTFSVIGMAAAFLLFSYLPFRIS
jgi:uncharacterized membrane protein YecN with MAPEG domain